MFGKKLRSGGPGGRSPPGKQEGLGGRQAPQWVPEMTFHKKIFLFVDICVEYLLQGTPIIVHFFTYFNISGLVFGATGYIKASIDLSRNSESTENPYK